MNSESKMISIDAFESIDDNNICTVCYNGIDISVKQRLSLLEMMRFVSYVVQGCFVTENSIYTPEVKDFYIGSNIIEAYTNIELPDDAAYRYEFITKNHKLIEMIINAIDKYQFNAILSSIDEKIDYVNSYQASELSKEINQLYSVINSIGDQFANLFDGVKDNEIKDFMNAITNMKLDENELAKAIIANNKSNNEN